MILETGMLKVALEPMNNKKQPTILSDAQIDAIMALDNIDGIESAGAQPDLIIAKFDSINDMNIIMPSLKEKIFKIISNKSLRHKGRW
jgi:hypothetical protein